MRILLTNDDGIDAGGLHALAAALRPLGEVTVAAPATNQTGVSRAMRSTVRMTPGRSVTSHS